MEWSFSSKMEWRKKTFASLKLIRARIEVKSSISSNRFKNF
jgi:hypothetical protein